MWYLFIDTFDISEHDQLRDGGGGRGGPGGGQHERHDEPAQHGRLRGRAPGLRHRHRLRPPEDLRIFRLLGAGSAHLVIFGLY